jgi:hypothetical protein
MLAGSSRSGRLLPARRVSPSDSREWRCLLSRLGGESLRGECRDWPIDLVTSIFGLRPDRRHSVPAPPNHSGWGTVYRNAVQRCSDTNRVATSHQPAEWPPDLEDTARYLERLPRDHERAR